MKEPVEKHACRNCENLEKEKKEVMEGRLRGRYRYGCRGRESGFICGFLMEDEELETLSCGFWRGHSGKKAKKPDAGRQLGDTLQMLFDRWNQWKQQGCPEAQATDGVYLNRLRQAIQSVVRKIEDACEEEEYPDSYFSPIPPVMAEDYMADPSELERRAMQALERFQHSAEYLWLEEYRRKQETAGKTAEDAGRFFEHAEILERAIREKDYLLMKKEARQEGLLAELSRFRREILHKNKKADERRRKRREVTGQLRFLEEKAS